MTSQLRRDWQDFKRKHPTFERSRNFKSDVGPQLDRFDKARDEFAAMGHALERKAAEVVALGVSVAAALKEYGAVVTELQKSDRTIKSDFSAMRFDSFVDTYVKQYARRIDWE